VKGINEYAHSQDDGLDAPISGHYTKSPGHLALEQLPVTVVKAQPIRASQVAREQAAVFFT
jgi:hypothetical protein